MLSIKCPMRGIVIAAGMGVRMGALTECRPKCMLEVGSGPLLDATIERMKMVGCDEIILIVGHCADQIDRDDVIRIQNLDFNNNNILHSLMYASEYMHGPLVISYSDIWVEPDIYTTLLKTEGDIVIAADCDWRPYYEGRTEHPLSEAENIIFNANEDVTHTGKTIDPNGFPENRCAEFLGLWHMTAAGTDAFVKCFNRINSALSLTDPFQDAKEWQKSYITDILREMINAGQQVSAALVERGWAELDTRQDIERLPEVAERQRLYNYIESAKTKR